MVPDPLAPPMQAARNGSRCDLWPRVRPLAFGAALPPPHCGWGCGVVAAPADRTTGAQLTAPSPIAPSSRCGDDPRAGLGVSALGCRLWRWVAGVAPPRGAGVLRGHMVVAPGRAPGPSPFTQLPAAPGGQIGAAGRASFETGPDRYPVGWPIVRDQLPGGLRRLCSPRGNAAPWPGHDFRPQVLVGRAGPLGLPGWLRRSARAGCRPRGRALIFCDVGPRVAGLCGSHGGRCLVCRRASHPSPGRSQRPEVSVSPPCLAR